MSKFTLEIDYREKCLKDYFQSKSYCKIENLTLGDVILKYENNIILLIERKTTEDLASSIRDGRHKEQKYRLMNSNIKLKNIIFLVEGELRDMKHGKVDKKTLQGSIINTMFRDGISVYRTENINETIYFIERLMDKVLKDKKCISNLVEEISDTKLDYVDTKVLSKKKCLTPEVYNQLILMQIPGVSKIFVDTIMEKYSSIKKIINEYNNLAEEKEKENLLAELELKGKKRKIGKVISKRIYEFLFSE
tara:strand:+ start:575 stop:1321 length:747 start_codon:yes stop_codon:yes gene_type:complete